ncbi:MAG: hypothetical protein ACYS83_04485 [Planctomycetota bacterium]|jgi:hypothetical protein
MSGVVQADLAVTVVDVGSNIARHTVIIAFINVRAIGWQSQAVVAGAPCVVNSVWNSEFFTSSR